MTVLPTQKQDFQERLCSDVRTLRRDSEFRLISQGENSAEEQKDMSVCISTAINVPSVLLLIAALTYLGCLMSQGLGNIGEGNRLTEQKVMDKYVVRI